MEEANRILYRNATWKSWKNQDYCLIGKKTDYNLFKKTDMHLWYDIKGTVDRKLSAQLEELRHHRAKQKQLKNTPKYDIIDS